MKKTIILSLLIITITAVVACLVLNCSAGTFSKLKVKKENVVFILIDTLRADRLTIYGAEKDTSPFLNSLAQNAVVFDSAVAASSWTAPAVASLFSSQYPSEHGVITGFVVTKKIQSAKQSFEFNRLASSQFTLPEYFKSLGYQTIGIADNMNISPELGFDQGFDSLDTFQYKTAEVVNAKARERLNNRDPEKPLFLYLHYMDPHYPFHARQPWYEKSSDRKQDIKNKYDSEISYVDEQIRRLFEEFPFLKDSLVVVTADHGEQFWEHGQRGHGKTLHRPEIHIPLFFYHPRLKEQKRIRVPVTSIDILPTLAELTGGAPDANWRGKSLSAVIEGNSDSRGAFSELLFHEENSRGPEFRSLVKGANHMIKRLGVNPVISAYEWLIDKNEKNARRVEIDSPEWKLFETYENNLTSAEHEKSQVDFDEAAVEQLKTLGYVQ